MVLSSDSFNRTNSSTSLGSTDGGTIGALAWTAGLGTWGISSNQAYCPTPPGGTNDGVAYVDLSAADVDITLVIATLGSDTGIVFRLTDTNHYWTWEMDAGGTAQLFQKNGSGSFVQIGSNHAGGVNGDTLEVVTSGSSIKCYRNGSLLETQTNSYNSTATKHGINTYVSTSRLDSWSVTAPLAYSTTVSDTVDISDITARNVSLSKALSNTDNISDLAQVIIIVNDTISISDSVGRLVVDHKILSNTINISNSVNHVLADHKTLPDTIDISDTTARRITLYKTNINTADISDIVLKRFRVNLLNTINITDVVSVGGVFIQYDSWRPVPKPTDNSLILICRTPVTEHDSLTGLQHLALWVVHPNGSNERLVMKDPTLNGYGWLRQSHPEWSPDGQTVVLATETSSEYQLVFVNSSAYGL